MSTEYLYAVIGLTAAVTMVVGVTIFALLRVVAAARGVRGHRESSGDTASLSAALQEAVTKLRAQEQAMSARAEASERLSAEIVASLTAGLLVVNHTGAVEILNPAARRLLELGDMPLGDYRAVLASVAPLADAIHESLGTHRPIVRRTLQLRDGRVSLGVTISPFGAADAHHGVICLFSDLTGVADLEKQLRLKETLAQLGELTAGIAHEFRNGLATIHGYSHLMDPKALPEAYRPYITAIRGETDALGRVVTNFLNFAKPDRVVFAPVDLGALSTRVTEEIQADTGVSIRMEGEFPIIEGDDVLLRQMLSNLIRNAVEAARTSGMPPTVRVSGVIDRSDQMCQVAVEDNGPGVDPALHDRVFRPFFTTKPQGTGLGLAIVQKIVVTHNGRVAVRSSPLGGARFEISLPY
jgi:signal transduction histidine kinase